MTTKIYFQARLVDQVLLAVVIVWEGTSAVLLWRAALRWTRSRTALAPARGGLLLLSLLWFAFAICTETFIAYERRGERVAILDVGHRRARHVGGDRGDRGGSLVRRNDHTADPVGSSQAHRH